MIIAQKKKVPVSNQDSAIEQLKNVGQSVAQTVGSDLVGGVVSNAFDSLLGVKRSDEVNIQPQEITKQQEIPQIRPPEITLFSAAEQSMIREVEEVRKELASAVSEVKELNAAIVEVEKATFTPNLKAGRYHISFFERLRTIIKLFRQQISESRVWLEATVSKKKKKGYWGMFKKHGTSFAMSNERALASQAG